MPAELPSRERPTTSEPGSSSAAQDTGERLRLRAALFGVVRSFFAARDVLEVDTPALAAAANPDPAVEPVVAHPVALGPRPHLLHTSPELPMKRLLAAGSGDIWQLCRVFRDGELGRWHEPEFMLLEWYRLGFDEHALMHEVAALLNTCFALRDRRLPVTTLTYRDALLAHAGIDPFDAEGDNGGNCQRRLTAAGIDVPVDLSLDGCLDLAISTLVIPALPRDTIVFIHDYPASQASLAALKDTTPLVAARFEVFVDGIELGNGFRELTDAKEQRARFERDTATRARNGARPIPLDEDFLAALDRGLPDCAGVALGFDRLAAIAAGAERLADAINFPHATG